jgi:hypothetical protein
LGCYLPGYYNLPDENYTNLPSCRGCYYNQDLGEADDDENEDPLTTIETKSFLSTAPSDLLMPPQQLRKNVFIDEKETPKFGSGGGIPEE